MSKQWRARHDEEDGHDRRLLAALESGELGLENAEAQIHDLKRKISEREALRKYYA